MKRSMMQVYIKESNKALEFYQKAFDAKIAEKHLHEDGTIAHAELDIHGQILAICETRENDVNTGNTMQFCLHFGKKKEAVVKKAYGVLKEDCIKLTAPLTSPGECPWSPCLFGVIDRFGVNWCIYA